VHMCESESRFATLAQCRPSMRFKQWRDKPYLLNGEPVEVDSHITINFTLSGRFGILTMASNTHANLNRPLNVLSKRTYLGADCPEWNGTCRIHFAQSTVAANTTSGTVLCHGDRCQRRSIANASVCFKRPYGDPFHRLSPWTTAPVHSRISLQEFCLSPLSSPRLGRLEARPLPSNPGRRKL